MDSDKKETLDPEMGKLIEQKTASPFKETAYVETKTGKALPACLLYTFSSVSMVLVNKSLASR